jgi:hypothetical protein
MSVITGDTAHDYPDGGHPIKLGGRAAAAPPAGVGDGDRVDAYFDQNGRQVVAIGTPLPAGGNTIGAVSVAAVPAVGTHANAWDAAAVGVGGVSAAVDAQYAGTVSAFGNVSAATTITVQYSQNNADFYDGAIVVLAGAGTFALDVRPGARYLRLKSSAAVTVTATIAGKGV